MMMRIVVDQSYTTHLRTCILAHTNQYCSTQNHHGYWTDYVESQDCVLLEDNGFDRIITKISRYTQEPCNVAQFKSIINREIALGQMQQHISTQIMTFLITKTMVNNEMVDAPRGQIGSIQCQVQLIMLKSKILPKHIINDCKSGSLRIIPKSLYTVEYLNKHTSWSDYALVYIYDYMVKCVVIKDQQYHEIHYLNRGLDELSKLMNEMNVGKYYHMQQAQMNNLTRNLVITSVNQYAHILGQRLSKHITRGSSITMINQMSNHKIIHEQCNTYLSEHYGFYTMECSHTLPRISKHGDVDAQLYLSQQYQS